MLIGFTIYFTKYTRQQWNSIRMAWEMDPFLWLYYGLSWNTFSELCRWIIMRSVVEFLNKIMFCDFSCPILLSFVSSYSKNITFNAWRRKLCVGEKRKTKQRSDAQRSNGICQIYVHGSFGIKRMWNVRSIVESWIEWFLTGHYNHLTINLIVRFTTEFERFNFARCLRRRNLLTYGKIRNKPATIRRWLQLK